MFFNSKLMKLAAVLKLTDFKDKPAQQTSGVSAHCPCSINKYDSVVDSVTLFRKFRVDFRRLSD